MATVEWMGDSGRQDEIVLGRPDPTRQWWTWLALFVAGLAIVGLATWIVVRPAPVVSGSPRLGEGTSLAVDGQEVSDALTPGPKRAVIGSANVFVTLMAYGPVTSVHESTIDVGPAPGDRLLAFQLGFSAGDKGSFDGPGYGQVDVTGVDLGVRWDGGAAHQLPLDAHTADSGQLFVASVPARAGAVELVLRDAGITQVLSLLTATPGRDNLEVLQRTDRLSYAIDYGHAVGRVHDLGDDFIIHLDISVHGESLTWFSPYGDLHASSPATALLHVDLCYTGREFIDSSTCHSFRHTDLFLTPLGGKPVRAVEAGSSSEPYPVFDVPANFSRGVLTVRGSESSGDGWNMQITTPFSVNIVF